MCLLSRRYGKQNQNRRNQELGSQKTFAKNVLLIFLGKSKIFTCAPLFDNANLFDHTRLFDNTR